MASQAGRVAAPPADPRLVMPAGVSALAQSGVSTIRPRSEAGTTVNAASWDDSRVMRPVLTAVARACPWGIVMFESPTLNLVQELGSVREFTVTEDHLKLLRRVYVAWDFGEGYGAPGINPKKPYGNSSVERDIAEILDVADEDWIYEDGHKAYVTPEAEERFTRLHVETMVVLQIVLATGEFRPGRYRRATAWGIDWQRDESGR